MLLTSREHKLTSARFNGCTLYQYIHYVYICMRVYARNIILDCIEKQLPSGCKCIKLVAEMIPGALCHSLGSPLNVKACSLEPQVVLDLARSLFSPQTPHAQSHDGGLTCVRESRLYEAREGLLDCWGWNFKYTPIRTMSVTLENVHFAVVSPPMKATNKVLNKPIPISIVNKWSNSNSIILLNIQF